MEMDLNPYREQIDLIDKNILELLNKRAEMAIEIGKIKKMKQQSLYVPSREKQIFERLEAFNPGPLPKEAIFRVYREIISASLSLEYPIKVVYLGPRATFTHVATLDKFGQSASLIPAKTIAAVFEDVAKGRADYGVVPIENSNEGAVTHTLDLFLSSDLKINEESYLEISHDFLSKTGSLENIETVYSHPQAIEQCRMWLENHLPNAHYKEVDSTARAAQIVSEDDPSAGAIANKYAADLYGLSTLSARIENNQQNFTRFLIISREYGEPTESDKTSILFTFEDQPGILGKMIEPFRKRNLNLMKIESRPVKKKAWQYVFFIDVEGHIKEPKLKEAIEDLDKITDTLKVLGSYPSIR